MELLKEKNTQYAIAGVVATVAAGYLLYRSFNTSDKLDDVVDEKTNPKDTAPALETKEPESVKEGDDGDKKEEAAPEQAKGPEDAPADAPPAPATTDAPADNEANTKAEDAPADAAPADKEA